MRVHVVEARDVAVTVDAIEYVRLEVVSSYRIEPVVRVSEAY